VLSLFGVPCQVELVGNGTSDAGAGRGDMRIVVNSLEMKKKWQRGGQMGFAFVRYRACNQIMTLPATYMTYDPLFPPRPINMTPTFGK
jgi:hypothetical protein